jgi:NADH dehydrogenase/NADH:ubiquinone oxidoreductase subunit G
MEFPRRVFDGEGVKADVDFGPTLMLNRNRCILCTRCVRFMKEIDGDAQIGIVDRATRARSRRSRSRASTRCSRAT